MVSKDIKRDIIDHIAVVEHYLYEVVHELRARAAAHDASKLQEPELSGYVGLSEAVCGVEYGTPEYKAVLESFGNVIRHHYQHNSHHPEYYPGGVNDMSLLDVIEMMADWRAAVDRAADGDMQKSMEISKKRFGISDQLYSILVNTVRELGWD